MGNNNRSLLEGLIKENDVVCIILDCLVMGKLLSFDFTYFNFNNMKRQFRYMCDIFYALLENLNRQCLADELSKKLANTSDLIIVCYKQETSI